MFFLVFSVIFVLGLSRAYLTNSAISKTAEAEKFKTEIVRVKNDIQGMEIAYLDRLNGLDLFLAESLGFVSADASEYLYKEKKVARGSDYAQNFR